MTLVDEGEDGFGWIAPEPPWMGRASHALVADGRVWLVDPVELEELDERVRALGEPAAVLQLVKWHNRDAAQIARRLAIPHLVTPARLDGSPFEVVEIPGPFPGWRETALWWPERRTLVSGEALGTIRYYRPPGRLLGLHPFLRLRPPAFLERYEPEHILCGHGAGVHDGAAGALREALANARRDLPRVLPRLLTATRHSETWPPGPRPGTVPSRGPGGQA